MSRVGRFATDNGAYVQSHLSENQQELEWVRTLFPESPSYTHVYDKMGLLGSRTIMAHCIHLGEPEVHLLRDTQTKVAFCPASNRSLRSGIMPYRRWREAGLAVGLGTDIAGGPSLSMFRQMGEAVYAHGTVSVTEALYLATLGGANVLGIADTVGNFMPGKEADFVVVDTAKFDPLRGRGSYNKPEDLLWRLCSTAGAHCVSQVYVRGRRLLPPLPLLK